MGLFGIKTKKDREHELNMQNKEQEYPKSGTGYDENLESSPKNSESNDFETDFSRDDINYCPEVEMIKIDNSNIMISADPITQEQYEAIMGSNPSFEKNNYEPVDSISWWETIKFCNRLSVLQGKSPVYKKDIENNLFIDFNADGYRLPSFFERKILCELANIPKKSDIWEWVWDMPKEDDKSFSATENRGNFRYTVGYKPNGSITFGWFQAKKRKKTIGFRVVKQIYPGKPRYFENYKM